MVHAIFTLFAGLTLVMSMNMMGVPWMLIVLTFLAVMVTMFIVIRLMEHKTVNMTLAERDILAAEKLGIYVGTEKKEVMLSTEDQLKKMDDDIKNYKFL